MKILTFENKVYVCHVARAEVDQPSTEGVIEMTESEFVEFRKIERDFWRWNNEILLRLRKSRD